MGGIDVLTRIKDNVNWSQWAMTVLPLMCTGIVGLIGLYRTVENRVLIQEQLMIQVTKEMEDHRSRIAKLEGIVNRNDEKLLQVLNEAKETREEIKGIRRDLTGIASGVRAVRQQVDR